MKAVAFGRSNTVYVAGEGGGKSQPGTSGGPVMRELRPRPALDPLAAVATLAVATCARQVRNVQVTPARRPDRRVVAGAAEPRDLFHGPGGEERCAAQRLHVRCRGHHRLEPRLRRADATAWSGASRPGRRRNPRS